MADTPAPISPHYRQPGWFTRNVFNRAVEGLTRLGVSVWGSRIVRANGGRVDLLLGKRRTHHLATELADADKVDVLRAYLSKWKAEVGVFFDGVGGDSSDDEVRAIAPRHPVFLLADAPA